MKTQESSQSGPTPILPPRFGALPETPSESGGKADSGAPWPEIPHGISHKLTRTARPQRGPRGQPGAEPRDAPGLQPPPSWRPVGAQELPIPPRHPRRTGIRQIPRPLRISRPAAFSTNSAPHSRPMGRAFSHSGTTNAQTSPNTPRRTTEGGHSCPPTPNPNVDWKVHAPFLPPPAPTARPIPAWAVPVIVKTGGWLGGD
jgi:hypothetical protein